VNDFVHAKKGSVVDKSISTMPGRVEQALASKMLADSATLHPHIATAIYGALCRADSAFIVDPRMQAMMPCLVKVDAEPVGVMTTVTA
jgi:hypothetical protein